MTNWVDLATYNDRCIQMIRFPQKLWKIINECKSGAIFWSVDGKSILLEYSKFQDEYLTPKTSIFKTSNITSFIRQLNLYGFRKISNHRDVGHNSDNSNVHEFQHENFRAHHPDLLPMIYRKINLKKKLGQKKELKSILKSSKEFDFPHKRKGLTRLQICQFALKGALDQALRQHKKQKMIESTKKPEKYSSTDGEISTDRVFVIFEIDTLEKSQEKCSSELETRGSIENVIYEVPEDQFLDFVKETVPYFYLYFVTRNL